MYVVAPARPPPDPPPTATCLPVLWTNLLPLPLPPTLRLLDTAAKPAAAAKTTKRKGPVALTDGRTQQNVGIALARFRMPALKIKEMVRVVVVAVVVAVVGCSGGI